MNAPTLTTPENLGSLLEETAAKHPNAPAWHFIEDGGPVTYADLVGIVNRAANGFRACGISKGTHVAIMADNSIAFCASWLALAKLGAVTIAVNTRYTARELEYILNDSDASFLIIDEQYLAVYEQSDIARTRRSALTVITSTANDSFPLNWPDLIADQSDQFAATESVYCDNIVNIQYTSGTTGFPKGCLLSHRFWMHSSKATTQSLGFSLQRVIYNQNFFYMDGPFLASACLHAGACLFLVTTPSAKKFAQWVRDHRIQYCFFFEAVYKQPEAAIDADNELQLLQTFGFNKNNHADLERRYATLAREAYGMTECGGALAMPTDDTSMVGSGSCGLPIADREVSIRDDNGNIAVPGEIGELWIRGPGIMSGYYKKPEATAETLVDGWIRTGDLFRQDDRGYYYIVGRKKDMVRRNGENIACREVEAVLRELPQVREVAVVPVADERVGEEVKAYVVLQPGFDQDSLTPQDILAHCEKHLAVFKTPRYIAYRDSFPMTDSDRVEKQKVIAESTDLTLNSFDRIDNVWR